MKLTDQAAFATGIDTLEKDNVTDMLDKLQFSLTTKNDKRTHGFFITSYGCTGGERIAKLLAMHPDIYCASEKRIGLVDSPEDKDFDSLSADKLIQTMQKRASRQFYGNVDAYTATHLENRLKGETCSYPFSRVNLVRHPFTRIDAFVRQWSAGFRKDSTQQIFMMETAHTNPSWNSLKALVLDRYRVDFADPANCMFIYAILQQGNDVSDFSTASVQVTYERLFHDTEYFLYFLSCISDRKLEVPRGFIEQYLAQMQANEADYEHTSHAIVQGWQKWQVFLARFWVETNPDAMRIYQSLGYNVHTVFDVPLS